MRVSLVRVAAAAGGAVLLAFAPASARAHRGLGGPLW